MSLHGGVKGLLYHHQGWEWWEWTAQAVIDQSIMMQASCSVRFFILIFLHLRCECTRKMGSIGFRLDTSDDVVARCRIRSGG